MTRKIFQINELPVSAAATPRKIFKTSDLHAKYSKVMTCWKIFAVVSETFFLALVRKILIPGVLRDADASVPRKILSKKDLHAKYSEIRT